MKRPRQAHEPEGDRARSRRPRRPDARSVDTTEWLPRSDYGEIRRSRRTESRKVRSYIIIGALTACIAGVVLIMSALGTEGRVLHNTAKSAAGIAPALVGGHPAHNKPTASNHVGRAVLARDLGQMVIARFAGESPSPALLQRVRAGQVGGVILFSDNFAGGNSAARSAIQELQREARVGGTWPLLVMADQEGRSVRRILTAPPVAAASEMATPSEAYAEGAATGRALAQIGVNVDLAPVADVEHAVPSFLGTRAFGASPAVVAARACAFARGLRTAGVAYTLKHFPGLGRASASTDNGPVTIGASVGDLRSDYSVYRKCGRGDLAVVMISSAGYPALTGSATPAVLDRETYSVELRRADVDAVTISDDLQAGAIRGQVHPALRAINAGLDLLLYAQTEEASSLAYTRFLQDLQAGAIDRSRVLAATMRIERLKKALSRTTMTSGEGG